MCDAFTAVAVVGLLITTATTAYSIDEQNKNVKAENQAREVAAESARESAREGYSATNLSLQQEEIANTQAKIENAKRAAEAKGTARSASGQAGVAGLSVEHLMADFNRQEATFRAVTDQNFAFSVEQSQRQMKGIRATARSRENSLAPQKPPGYLGAGLRIGAQAVGSYDQYKKNTDPNYYRGL